MDVYEINVEVKNYYGRRSGFADELIFEVSVRCGPALDYVVERSKNDFIELDKQLRKKYPKSSLKDLPCMEANIRKRASIMGDGILINTAPILNQPNKARRMSAPTVQSPSTKRISIEKSSTGINEKKTVFLSALTVYLQSILKFHEFLASDELLMFFDRGVSALHGSLVETKKNNDKFVATTIHDILLANIHSTKTIVHKAEEILRSANYGKLLVWQFSTVGYDIGFSVEVNGEVKVPYSRCASHQKHVEGTLEINSSANANNKEEGLGEEEARDTITQNHPVTCKLKWDNSYALFRVKELSFKVAVVKVSDYEKAKEKALDIEKQHKLFELHRHTLKLHMLRTAVTLSSGVHYGASIEDELAILSAMSNSNNNGDESESISQIDAKSREICHEKEFELQQRLENIQEELATYRDSVAHADLIVRDAEEAQLAAERTRDSIYNSWKFTTSQLESALIDLRAAKSINALHSEEKQLMQIELNKLASDVRQQAQIHEVNMLLVKSDHDVIVSELKQQLQEMTCKYKKLQAVTKASHGLRSAQKATPSKLVDNENNNSHLLTPKRISTL